MSDYGTLDLTYVRWNRPHE